MAQSIWQKCEGEKYISSLHATVWRLVEAQYKVATRKLVDSLEEQAILEELIETSKPLLSEDCEHLHPLLRAAFCYPPLKHGSRFGTMLERSIWYGSLTLNTAMAEKAYYQFNFIRASKADYDMVEIPLTAFSIDIHAKKGVDLTQRPFSNHQKIISSPISYEESQALGAAMRALNIEAFRYCSARDARHGDNVGLLTPNVFKQAEPHPTSFQSWQCIATDNKIDFIRTSASTTDSNSFTMDTFLVNGELPFPAN